MTSVRNNTLPREEAVLSAARECVLAVGMRRTRLTDVAHRAGVSRMTIYRYWPDMTALIADLMTREWGLLSAASEFALVDASAPTTSEQPTTPEQLSAALVGLARALRDNALFRKILDVDPELLLPYLLSRRGRSQDALLKLLEAAIRAGQQADRVRDGDPTAMARTVVLAAHGFAISAITMTRPTSLNQLADELQHMIERYLTP